jgi:hypothetical protein
MPNGSLTVEELVRTFAALGGVADWHQVQEYIWEDRGATFDPYKDKGNYDTTMWQLLYRHTPGFAKFRGNALFQTLGPSRYRLLDYNPLVPEQPTNKANEVDDLEAAARRSREIQEYKRNQELVREIKDLYKSQCQRCGTRLLLPSGEAYAEAHHIKGLGLEGPDVLSNMLCVCANCHALLDLKAVGLQRESLYVVHPAHIIDDQFLIHHNDLWRRKWMVTDAAE